MSTRPDLLFIVTNNQGKILYYCHSLVELFRLREIRGCPDDIDTSIVYRHDRSYSTIATDKSDKRFIYESLETGWRATDANTEEGIGLPFRVVTYGELEPNYKIVMQIQRAIERDRLK